MQELARAFTTLVDRGHDVQLDVLGAGVDPSVVRRRVRQRGPPRAYTCGPARDDAEIAAAMREADIFVLPSLFEGTPLTLIEAMWSGLAIRDDGDRRHEGRRQRRAHGPAGAAGRCRRARDGDRPASSADAASAPSARQRGTRRGVARRPPGRTPRRRSRRRTGPPIRPWLNPRDGLRRVACPRRRSGGARHAVAPAGAGLAVDRPRPRRPPGPRDRLRPRGLRGVVRDARAPVGLRRRRLLHDGSAPGAGAHVNVSAGGSRRRRSGRRAGDCARRRFDGYGDLLRNDRARS